LFAFDSDFSAVGFYDHLANDQPQAGSLLIGTLAAASFNRRTGDITILETFGQRAGRCEPIVSTGRSLYLISAHGDGLFGTREFCDG